MSEDKRPILITGAAGRVGSIGARVIEILRESNVPVRALVRQIDERSDRLKSLGAEVVVADLTKSEEVFPAVQGCRLVFFSISVSNQYLEASAVMAAAARACDNIELVLNMSQMTISEMDLVHVTESPQHRLQWLGEQVLNWSGLPVTHLRATSFQENPIFWGFAAESINKSGTIRVPFGRSGVSPVAAKDVAQVAAKILLEPSKFAGQAVELTGPRVADMYSLAEDYTAALGRPVRYEEVSLETWIDETIGKIGLPEHIYRHLLTMAKLHAKGDYDRYTNSVQTILGRPATSLLATILENRSSFPVS